VGLAALRTAEGPSGTRAMALLAPAAQARLRAFPKSSYSYPTPPLPQNAPFKLYHKVH